MESLVDFFMERSDFLHVTSVENENGNFDVVLRIDGSYAHEEDALDAVDYFRRILWPLVEDLGPMGCWYGRYLVG